MFQGNRIAVDFTIKFRTLAAQSGWNYFSLKAVFKQGLNLELQTELTCKAEDLSFSEFVTMAIKIDKSVEKHSQEEICSSASLNLPHHTNHPPRVHANKLRTPIR